MKFDPSGWWLPDNEEYLPAFLQDTVRVNHRHSYQHRKYLEVLKYIPKVRKVRAIDIGAHVGLWTWMMLDDFDYVEAFEPIAEHCACWRKNIPPRRATLWSCALGNENRAAVTMDLIPTHSMRSRIAPPDSKGSFKELVLMCKLDDFKFPAMELIKIDCEGYELEVVKGGKETILQHKPTLIIEQKPDTQMDRLYGTQPGEVIDLLRSWGAVVYTSLRDDYIMGWPSHSAGKP